MERTLSTDDFVRLLGIWQEGEGPLYGRLSNRVRHLVEDGTVPGSTMLPSERRLAAGLGVGRRTVETAYEELRELGVVARRIGVGTWVRPSARKPPRARRPAASDSFVQALLEGTASIDLTVASMPAHPLVTQARRETASWMQQVAESSVGYFPAGLDILRARVCSWFEAHGVPTEPDQVAITTGAAQGLWLAAEMLEPGTVVYVENPTSPTILTALRGHPVSLRASATTGQGMQVRSIPAGSNDAIFVTPAYVNPTGEVLSRQRCAELAALAAHGTVVVEDLALFDLRIDGTRSTMVASRAARDAPVLSIGSMSKLFWAGLRVGWIRGPVPLIRRINKTKAMLDIGAAVDSQAQAAWLLEHTQEVIEDRIATIRPRRDEMLDCLHAAFPGATIPTPAGGFSIWAEVPSNSTVNLCNQLSHAGIQLLPGTAFDVLGRDPGRIRLPFTAGEGLNAAIVERIRRACDV